MYSSLIFYMDFLPMTRLDIRSFVSFSMTPSDQYTCTMTQYIREQKTTNGGNNTICIRWKRSGLLAMEHQFLRFFFLDCTFLVITIALSLLRVALFLLVVWQRLILHFVQFLTHRLEVANKDVTHIIRLTMTNVIYWGWANYRSVRWLTEWKFSSLSWI